MCKLKKWMLAAIVLCGTSVFMACTSKKDNPSVKDGADLVVYGKIFTSENNQIVEAFAVKDGKYVYVGDKAGAEAFVETGKTEVIDYSGKGLVMPGCGNGHSHYMLGYALRTVGTMIGLDVNTNQFLKEIVPAAVTKAKAEGATSIFGQGWRLQSLDPLPTREDLDAICSDIPMYFLDEECHKALGNTILLKKAGIINEDGTPQNKVLHMPASLTYRQYCCNTAIGCLTVIIDRQMTGPFEMPDIRSSHDMGLWLEIMKRGFTAYALRECLASYRIVATSNTAK
jgi:hypothetical protein